MDEELVLVYDVFLSYRIYFLEKNARKGLVGKKHIDIPVGFNVSKILMRSKEPNANASLFLTFLIFRQQQSFTMVS